MNKNMRTMLVGMIVALMLTATPMATADSHGDENVIDTYTGMPAGARWIRGTGEMVAIEDMYTDQVITKRWVRTTSQGGWEDPMTGHMIGTQRVADTEWR
jgi:cobalamin biosynthesis Co2+ chelatase CbiK